MSDTVAVPELETPNLRLRAWLEADAAVLHEAFGDAETMRFWDSPPARDVVETGERIRGSRAVDPRFHAAFSITRREDGAAIGMINHHARQPAMRRLAVGWILLPAWQRRGLMRESVPAVLDHCFEALDAHRIEARIEAENASSVRLAEWLGFEREGLMRDWMFVDGEPRSPCLYALLRPHWRRSGK